MKYNSTDRTDFEAHQVLDAPRADGAFAAPGGTMRPLTHLTVLSAHCFPLLAVECRGGDQPSAERAAEFRQYRAAHNILSAAPFYMLACTKTLFLWRRDTSAEAMPDFQASMKSIFMRYAPAAWERSPCNGTFVIDVVRYWLRDLVSEFEPSLPESPADQLLVSTGLYEQFRNGRILVAESEP